MATIIPHTTRSAGTILTAAIYNSDHQVHITNATSLNSEVSGYGTIVSQNANAVAITGGAANGMTLGASTPSSVAATTLSTTGISTFGAQIRLPDGSSGTPSISFSSDANTGFYWGGSGEVRFTSNSSVVLDFTGEGIQALSGTAAEPAYSFISDLDTGMYRRSANQLAFATDGTEAGYFDANQKLNLAAGLETQDDVTINGTLTVTG